MATASASRGWPNCWMSLGVDRARLAAHSVVVTGSNGKGSTAAMCAAIGRAHGLRTGPLHFTASVALQRADPDRWRRDQRRGLCAPEASGSSPPLPRFQQRRGERFGAFEALFALACLYFQENECEFIVFEAGIGGRYDPVRLVGARETCVTSVDYEHVDLLGNTLELIVSDKSDACAAGGTIVYGENCRGLRPHLIEYNRSRGVTSRFVRDEIGIDGESTAASGQRFDFRFGDHRLSWRRDEPCSARSSSTTPRSPSPCSCSGCSACSRARRRTDRSRDTNRPARHALARPARNHRAGSADGNRCRPHPRRHPAIAGQPEGDSWRATTGFSSRALPATRKRTRS